ncbi:hypothetical protein HK104_009144 [Borealophlyctis nickersoniae]|nr:hypothetical protein HK104_009144 [Borealophlyctis nickersoniae]
MDFCIIMPPTSTLTPAQCVEKLGSVLKQVGMKDVKMLTRARVPIVKMSGIRCDIGFGNELALQNTRLLAMYAKLDPRVGELAIIVKYWSKRRNINEPYFGTLSSYCYMLMLLHLLQLRNVLPVLQTLTPPNMRAPPQQFYGPHNIYFYDDLVNIHKVWTPTNTESVGELVVAFFKYYSVEFPYVHGVASVRTGRVVSKEEKGWTKERQQELNRSGGAGKDRFWLCVEDPFDTTHNVGRPVDKETLYEVRGEFIR